MKIYPLLTKYRTRVLKNAEKLPTSEFQVNEKAFIPATLMENNKKKI